MEEVKCSNPKCNFHVVVKSSDGYFRFTTKALKTLGDGHDLIAVCRNCGEETVIPMEVRSREKKEVKKSSRQNLNEGGFTVIYRKTSNNREE